MSSDIKNTLEQRGNIYGDYHGGVVLRSAMMECIKDEYRKNHNNAHMPVVYEHYLLDVLNKIIRLAVSPNHMDSWRDIAGYATLALEALERNGDGR